MMLSKLEITGKYLRSNSNPVKYFATLFLLLTLSCTTTQQPTATTADVLVLTPAEYKARKLTRKAVLLDVRTPEEYASGHLEDARNVDYRGGDFAEALKRWDKNKVYYLYCASGNRSGKAATLLQENGFRHVYNIGGFPALQQAGLPVKIPAQRR